MHEVDKLEIDYTTLTLTLKSEEGSVLKVIPFDTREALNTAATQINTNILRTLEAKQ